MAGIVATIRAALEAVPIIAKEIQNLRDSLETRRNESEQRELDEIKESLNKLSSRLQSTRDKDEMARIVKNLNRII